MKPVERLGKREREVIDERRSTGYHVAELKHFGGRLEPTLRTLIERLLPGVPKSIDLVSFVDSHAEEPMGRGDRSEGLGPVLALLQEGLTRLTEAQFANMNVSDQNDLISRMRNGGANDELGIQAKEFIDRLLDKALSGYLAHPDTWIRIGFTGPAFPEGYGWFQPAEVEARKMKAPGWESL